MILFFYFCNHLCSTISCLLLLLAYTSLFVAFMSLLLVFYYFFFLLHCSCIVFVKYLFLHLLLCLPSHSYLLPSCCNFFPPYYCYANFLLCILELVFLPFSHLATLELFITIDNFFLK